MLIPLINNKDREKIKYSANILLIATCLSVVQIYFLPLAGTFFPLSLIFSLLCIKYITLEKEDRFIQLLTSIYVVAMLFSVFRSADFGAWANGMLYGFLFFIGYFVAKSKKNVSILVYVIRFFLVVAVLNAVLVIIFRYLPDVESSFIGTGILNFFKNPKRVLNLDLFPPNVSDPLKAGGVFDNANTGAAFNLMCVGAVFSIANYLSRGFRFILFSLFAFAVFASGSKSAVLILVMLGFGVYSVYLYAKNVNYRLVMFAGLFFIIPLAYIFFYFFLGELFESNFFLETLETTSHRQYLLEVAKVAFGDHPFAGLGFGGWGSYIEEYAGFYGLEEYWPPHNGLVLAWTESGIVGALSLCVLIAYFLLQLARGMFRGTNPIAAAGALFSFSGTVVMSLGDTFPLIGSQNAAFPLGVLVAWGIVNSTSRESVKYD